MWEQAHLQLNEGLEPHPHRLQSPQKSRQLNQQNLKLNSFERPLSEWLTPYSAIRSSMHYGMHYIILKDAIFWIC